MSDKPLVTVICATYNQASYIKDALEGFLKQQTEFPFEVLIHDDASTDGTQEILYDYMRKYPNFKVFFEKENKYANPPRGGYFQGLLEKHAQGKYIAQCEGDDFWTDKCKLQRQFDYMESHPECVCCGHASLAVDSENTDNIIFKIGYGNNPCSVTTEMVINNINMQTATLFYRKGLGEKYSSEWGISSVIGDIPWLVWLCENGDVHYDPSVASVYRSMSIGSYSAENSRDILVMRNRQLIELFDALDVFTERKYSDAILDREAQYAYRGARYGGLKFLSKGNPGYKVRSRISIKKWVFLLVLNTYYSLKGKATHYNL